jgi:hypothetical protein
MLIQITPVKSMFQHHHTVEANALLEFTYAALSESAARSDYETTTNAMDEGG